MALTGCTDISQIDRSIIARS